MSRVGLKPIPLPDGVSVKQDGDNLHISGPKGELFSPVPPGISLVEEDGSVRFDRANDNKQTRAYHGLARALAANAVHGVHQGFQRDLVIEGIGYRAKMEGNSLVLSLGFSHPVDFPVPEGIEINVDDQTKISIKGIDKQRVGEIAAQIRRIRPPEPYKGKGVRYADEVVKKKVGKSGVGGVG
ncbi:MAG: 50S ribosomal protein L6 [Acidobacteriota bacterium]|jgi:large subunit ribosomal protein L6